METLTFILLQTWDLGSSLVYTQLLDNYVHVPKVNAVKYKVSTFMVVKKFFV